MISVNNITKEFHGKPVFSNVSFNINPKERIGLAGNNGAGKTTLLRIIRGEVEPDTGEVVIPRDVSVGYLPQEKQIDMSGNILEETIKVFSFILDLKKRLEAINKELEQRRDYHSGVYLRLLEEQSGIVEQLRIAEPDKVKGKAERILTGLGFEPESFAQPVNTLSTGWQMRVELGKLLLLNPDLLMLDEPTNHLDIESIQWLEDFLSGYSGTVLMVSHDRTLLDNLTTRTIEINNGRIYDYKVPYSQYVRLREERFEQQAAAFNNQQRQIRQIERFIERFRYKNTKARQVQSRIRYLEKLEKIEMDERDQAMIRFTFPPAPHSGKVTVTGKSVSKRYGAKQVLENIDLEILKGEKIAFVGRNGEGKTTLARIIAGETSCEGKITLGHNVITGYYAQDQWEMLDPEKTVFQTLDDEAVGDVRKNLRTILGAFLFQEDDIDKKVKVLSGGEKSRLALAKLLLTPSNLLILDEPTNHLDILSKDVLKNALLQYNGTLIIVSHDRDFLQGLTTRLYEFRNRKIKEFRGDIFDFLEKRKIENLKELEVNEKKKAGGKTKSGNKQKWIQKKEKDRQIRKTESAIVKLEETIAQLEDRLKEINEKLSRPDEFADEIKTGTLYVQHDDVTNKLEAHFGEWEKLHEQLELLKNDVVNLPE